MVERLRVANFRNGDGFPTDVKVGVDMIVFRPTPVKVASKPDMTGADVSCRKRRNHVVLQRYYIRYLPWSSKVRARYVNEKEKQ